MTHKKYMRTAIKLAQRAWGMTSPNPLVGAVIVKNDTLVGRGYHRRAGEPHAEINALTAAGSNAVGADLYVTLEPCSSHGRTPPCTEAIIKAGVKRVFIGSTDLNPNHSGQAVKLLEKAGIEVFNGIEKKRCDAMNEAFFKWITTGEPFVMLKMAMTLDGKIATAAGQSQWITGPEARKRVQQLRKWSDAIMVGGETVRRDQPSLTVRGPTAWPRQPLRLVVSDTLSRDALREYFPVGKLPEMVQAATPEKWRQLLRQLGKQDITALLIEGGGKLAASVLQAGIVDRVEFHVAPKILGGGNSRPVVGGADPASLQEALNLKNIQVKKYGNDIAISGDPEYIDCLNEPK